MRIRLRFSKIGKVRFTSHRDVARMWERALRRVGVPVKYTGGFSPRPKLSFGLALPTGHESLAEYLDVEVETEESPDYVSLSQRLSDALPLGVDVLGAGSVPAGSRSLQEEVTSCSWELVADPHHSLHPLVAETLARTTLVVTRDRKGVPVTDDVRPALLGLSVLAPGRLAIELANNGRGVRPSELIAAIAPDISVEKVCRTHQWIERDGARCEPLVTQRAPHAEACV